MDIELLNAGTLRPLGGALVSGRAPCFRRGLLVCRTILARQQSGLVLVDAGIGLVDIAVPWRRLGGVFMTLFSPALRASECIAHQLEARGLHREQVSDIVLTHLDSDCAGGLGDFPQAKVHVDGAELDTALGPRTLLSQKRYRRAQWAHAPQWRAVEAYPQRWFGFAASPPLPGLELEIRLIQLPGHSVGHCGVALRRERDWLLHVGDALWSYAALDSAQEEPPPLLQSLERVLEAERSRRLLTLAQLRQLCRQHGDEVDIVCSHDPTRRALRSGS